MKSPKSGPRVRIQCGHCKRWYKIEKRRLTKDHLAGRVCLICEECDKPDWGNECMNCGAIPRTK